MYLFSDKKVVQTFDTLFSSTLEISIDILDNFSGKTRCAKERFHNKRKNAASKNTKHTLHSKLIIQKYCNCNQRERFY